jgi:hypothetical protein
MKAISVKVIPKYKLQVTFDDGISGVIDLHQFIENGIFVSLKNEDLFDKAYTTGYSIAWSDELEIDSITVYAEILNKKPEDLLSSDLKYATN